MDDFNSKRINQVLQFPVLVLKKKKKKKKREQWQPNTGTAALDACRRHADKLPIRMQWASVSVSHTYADFMGVTDSVGGDALAHVLGRCSARHAVCWLMASPSLLPGFGGVDLNKIVIATEAL